MLAKLNCSDEDKEPNESPFGCSSITIQTGDDIKPKFTIVNNAVVTTNNVIDFDTGDVIYTLVIVGVDSSTRDPRKTGTMTIKVNIEPVNEFTPVIHDQPICTNVGISLQVPFDDIVGSIIVFIDRSLMLRLKCYSVCYYRFMFC